MYIYIRSSAHTEYGIEILPSPGIQGIELEKRYLEYLRIQLAVKKPILRIPLDHINSFACPDEFVIFPWKFCTFFINPARFHTNSSLFQNFCHINSFTFQSISAFFHMCFSFFFKNPSNVPYKFFTFPDFFHKFFHVSRQIDRTKITRCLVIKINFQTNR